MDDVASSDSTLKDAQQSAALFASSTATCDSSTASCASSTLSLPAYKMARGLETITQLYTEFNNGIATFPSIKQLNKAHGNRWRQGNNAEAVFYSRRKRLIEAIESTSREKGWSEKLTTDKFESSRVKQSKSLDWATKNVSKIKQQALVLGNSHTQAASHTFQPTVTPCTGFSVSQASSPTGITLPKS